MDDKNYLLFEEYCSGLLSEEERSVFEERLSQDRALSESFTLYKELSDFLEIKFGDNEVSRAFKENVQAVSELHFKKEEKGKVVRFRSWKYAVAASILLLAGLFFFITDSKPSYSDFAVHETISLAVRGNQDQLYLKAERAFNNASYMKAIGYFGELLKTDAENQEIIVYAAIAQLELDRYVEAEQGLATVAAGNSVYSATAQWYMALSRLKQKEYKACRAILEKIPEEYENYDLVEKLLRKL